MIPVGSDEINAEMTNSKQKAADYNNDKIKAKQSKQFTLLDKKPSKDKLTSTSSLKNALYYHHLHKSSVRTCKTVAMCLGATMILFLVVYASNGGLMLSAKLDPYCNLFVRSLFTIMFDNSSHYVNLSDEYNGVTYIGAHYISWETYLTHTINYDKHVVLDYKVNRMTCNIDYISRLKAIKTTVIEKINERRHLVLQRSAENNSVEINKHLSSDSSLLIVNSSDSESPFNDSYTQQKIVDKIIHLVTLKRVKQLLESSVVNLTCFATLFHSNATV